MKFLFLFLTVAAGLFSSSTAVAQNGVVIVSGGTLGIGNELVKKLYAEGWKVATFARSPEAIEALKKEFPDPKRFYAEALSVTDFEEVRSFVNRVQTNLGPIEKLVNNAGVTGSLNRVGESSSADIHNIVSTNLTGTINLTSTVVSEMKKVGTHGVIVNISSGSSEGVPGLAAYGATKAGINVFSSAVAKEYEADGIRVFSLNPGHVDTRLQTAARVADPAVFPAANHFKKFFDHNELVEAKDSASHIGYLLEHPSEFTNGAYVNYKDIIPKLAQNTGSPSSSSVIFTAAEVAAARASAIERLGPDAKSGKIWERFKTIKVDGQEIDPPKDLVDLEQRVLKQIHERISTSSRPIVRLQIGDKHFAINKVPLGQGMAGTVYSIADSNRVIKISKPMPLAIPFMIEEKERASTLEALMKNEHFFTPQNYEFDEFGIYGVKEKLNGGPLTDLLIENGVIKLSKNPEGKEVATLAPHDELQAALSRPVMQDLTREMEALMALRKKYPEIINDLGPDNLFPVFDKSGKLQGLSLVDIGPHTEKTKKRFDEAYEKGFSGYLSVAEKLVQRYIDTGLLGAARENAAKRALEVKAVVPPSGRKTDRKFSDAEESFLGREAQNDFEVVTAVHPDFLPGNGKFKVKYLLIPADEMRIVDSGLGSPEVRNLLFEKKDGKLFVRFPIHPESEHLYAPLIQKYGVAGEYDAGATSSTRAVLAHSSDGNAEGQLKLSLAQYQSKRGRIVPAWELRRSVGVTELAALTPHETWIKSGASIIPEVAGVYIPATWKIGSFVDAKQGEVFEHGVLLRDNSFLKEFPDHEIFPLFSLFAKREGKPPMIIEFWHQSGEKDFYKFIDKFLYQPFLEKNRYLMFHEGIIPEIHSQNLLVALNPKTRKIEHFFHRDAGSMKIDLRMRWLNGHSVAPLGSDDANFDFKFKRATEVIEEGFMRYFHDESFVRGFRKTLSEFVPNYDPEQTKDYLRRALAREIQTTFPLQDPQQPFKSVEEHLEKYYDENQPKLTMESGGDNYDPTLVNEFIRQRLKTGQALTLPGSWKKTLKLPEKGYLVTENGIVFDGKLAGAQYNGDLMLVYHQSKDRKELRKQGSPNGVPHSPGFCGAVYAFE